MHYKPGCDEFAQRRRSMKEAGMDILLAGFKDRNGARHFTFECVAADRSRTAVIVGADMALARKHDIRLQELPLICLRLIEALGDEGPRGVVITLTEDHMKAIQDESRNSAPTIKPHKQSKPASPNLGQAWRKPML
jgi:hypothetical protein